MSERNSTVLPQTVHLLLAAIGGLKMLRLPQKVQQVIAVKSFAGRGFMARCQHMIGNFNGGVVRADVIAVMNGTPSLQPAVRVSPAPARNVRGGTDCARRVASGEKSQRGDSTSSENAIHSNLSIGGESCDLQAAGASTSRRRLMMPLVPSALRGRP